MENDNKSDEEDFDYDVITSIKPVDYGDRYTTNPTIWVGLTPSALTATAAYNVTKDIRAFLNSLNITKIDIAYRETVPTSSFAHGPALLPIVEDGEPLKDVIDNVSVALSLPISGLGTPMQGTMGPYFRVGNRLLAITVRHNLLSIEAANNEYRYHGTLAIDLISGIFLILAVQSLLPRRRSF